jgi:hypothetical protein
MSRPKSASAALVLTCLLVGSGSSGQESSRQIKDRDGRVIEVLGPEGRPRDLGRPPAVRPSADAASRARSRRASAGEDEGPCPHPADTRGYVARESRGARRFVDSCGRITGEVPAAGVSASASATIDRMTTRATYGSYSPGGPLVLAGSADAYELSDGTQWSSGAGTYYEHGAYLSTVEVSGTTIRYTLSPPTLGLIYEQTDYDSGDHSAQGKLGPSGTLVLEAQTGSATAVLRGHAVVVSNDPTSYGDPRFNYYTAIVGSVVPFEITYTRTGGAWTPSAFASAFNYTSTGWVDFAHPVSTPPAVELTIGGPSRLPDASTTPFEAVARYASGATRNVTTRAVWTAQPAALASVTGGVLTIGTLSTAQETIVLRASYAEGSASLALEKQILCLPDDPAERPGSWPMFQANSRHTGYVPISLDPATFSPRWQRSIGGTLPLNPVAAGEGKVFVTLKTYFQDVTSLFALSALDGHTLWSKGFGSIFSVNPPSFAYGNVYVQTGNHGSDTWLHAFEGATGALLFKSPHSAQWERYFAPTVHEGKIYVNGGYYGGMYAFDAYTGGRLWFAELPQYDEWTPAVADGKAYAYVGEYEPGLYVRDRLTGIPAGFVPDPNFEWGGWSMNLAPVVGAHGDVVAIQDGRLISFDPAQGTIRREIAGTFRGQPSLARDRIYAVDATRLVVLDELTDGELWSWPLPAAVVGPLLVTDTHVFVSTAESVHAIDVVTRQEAWSYAKGGHLALADGTLYIASADGTLTAITAPEVVHAALVSLEVVGPVEVAESSSASYVARAHYADGHAAERTIQAEWSVAPERFAAIVGPGQLEARELIQPTHDVVVKARYSEQGSTVEGQLAVRIVIAVTPKQLVLRNVFATMGVKQGVLRDLEAALERETATLEVLLGLPSSPAILRARARVRSAICREERARSDVEWSLYDLAKAVEGWRGAPPIPSPPALGARPGRECVAPLALEEDGSTAQRP